MSPPACDVRFPIPVEIAHHVGRGQRIQVLVGHGRETGAPRFRKSTCPKRDDVWMPVAIHVGDRVRSKLAGGSVIGEEEKSREPLFKATPRQLCY